MFQDECYWDCELTTDPIFPGQLLPKDPACLKDCFEQSCLNLIFELFEKETCSAVNELLTNIDCINQIARHPFLVQLFILQSIMKVSETDQNCNIPYTSPTTKTTSTSNKLAPLQAALLNGGLIRLNFTNTRHRYPWICSLRTRGANSEHLCAVTLLSVPPQPTVVVGAAHCTYLCKEGGPEGVRLDSCCCTAGQAGCSQDRNRCGTQPVGVEMVGGEVDILCGEWETGSAPQNNSMEEFNIALPIQKIVRHPNFQPETGERKGYDLAIFMVDDHDLKRGSRQMVRPICLPPPGRKPPTTGVQAGWSRAPPPDFLERYGQGFLPLYTDLFKMWHYNLEIQKTCVDPNFNKAFNLPYNFPTDTYYPPGLMCAKDFTRGTCFTPGDSGSTLMAREETRPQRYYMEGLLSFIKNCDALAFSNVMSVSQQDTSVFLLIQSNENPAAYTRISCFLPWVAKQYGLSYPEDPEDQHCRQGTGVEATSQDCRAAVSELPCILPFYYKGELYDKCAFLAPANFLYGSFQCPVYNVNTKINGINDYGNIEVTDTKPS